MNHFTLPRFWVLYRQLPKEIQKLADRNYKLLRADPTHPSLHFKKIESKVVLWSVRVGIKYRALGRETPQGIVWFWIGSHADYNRLVK